MLRLEASKLFSHLPAAALDRLRAAARELRFAAGARIFEEGDPGDGVYVIQEGQVQISARLGTGEWHVLSRLGPAEVFGEMAVLDHHPRSACAQAGTETVVGFVPREPVVQLLKESPELALGMLQELSRRLRDFNRHYVQEVLQAERLALVGRFASSIVHDLKNPLAVINLAAELAGNPKADLATRQMAKERILCQVDRISSLVHDILEFTRGTPGDLVFDLADYAGLVRALVAELQPELQARGMTIDFEHEPPRLALPLHPARLRRVFHNLLGNAMDAMPEGGRIRLRFAVTDTEVTTEVEDTGQGIPASVLDRLFEPFVTHGKAHGTGLGLSICRQILAEHEGRISARNRPGGGALFAFTLPRHRTRPAAQPATGGG